MKLTFLLTATVLFSLFTLNACKDKASADPCTGISCINGGECINGDCNCPDEWEGPNCGNEKKPKSITIKTIKLTLFPLTKSGGSSWDLLSGPDVYVVLRKGTTEIGRTSVVNNLTTQFTFQTDIKLENPDDKFTILVFDEDDIGSDEEMGGIIFTPYVKGLAFPKVRALNCTGCATAFSLEGLTYKF